MSGNAFLWFRTKWSGSPNYFCLGEYAPLCGRGAHTWFSDTAISPPSVWVLASNMARERRIASGRALCRA